MVTPLDARLSNPREGGPSFSLGHRMFRAVWGVTWKLLASWTPPPLHRWRRFLLTLFGAKIDKTARVYGTAKIWYPPNLTMGAHACMGPDVICYSMGPITLEDYAMVSQRAHLCGGTHDPDNLDFQLIAKPIVIGENAWVAAETFVGPGVTVGRGAVLGARAVTVKSLQENMIYAGNPARPIRARRLERN